TVFTAQSESLPGVAISSGLIVSAGNVGIGTMAPGANLHISSPTASADQYMLKITTGTANADVFVVKGDGKVGIGTAAPTGLFQVGGGSLTVLSSGNIGVGTTAPQGRLDIVAGGNAATDMAQIWRNSSGDIVSSMSATGVISASTFTGTFVGDGSGLTIPAGKFATDPNRYVSGTGNTVSLSSYPVGVTLVSSGPGDITYTLPIGSIAGLGAQFIFVKLGTGKVTIEAESSGYIADGNTVHNNAYAPAYASITLRLVTLNPVRWMIFYGDGAWVTESE
ncbi:MAG: hypothetical protein NTY45_00275, partial [Elusimicrobia bacterium]|nr:hypothetical protein [Elusimicrobiota bacterium]